MKIPIAAQLILANGFFLLFHPALGNLLPRLPGSLGSLLVNIVLFVLPALGWAMLLPRTARGRGMLMFWCVFLSAIILLVLLVALRVLGSAPTAQSAWTGYWAVTNIGLLAAWSVRGSAAMWKCVANGHSVMIGSIFLAAYAVFYIGAAWVVPPQGDHDLEVQGTGYSLLTRQEPFLVTDRGTHYYFAHPPLLHMQVAGSILLFGRIEALRFYDEISQRSLAQQQGRETPFLGGKTYLFGADEGTFEITGRDAASASYRAKPEGGGDERLVAYAEVEPGRIYQRYYEQPLKLETRTPNIFLAALTVALLAQCLWFLSGRWWLALLGAAAYASSPEIFVRSSYGGYFAVGAFSVIITFMAIYRYRSRTVPVAAGIFTALVDHKLVVLPAAIGLQGLYHWLISRPWRPVTVLLHPAVVGFVIGTALFWAYGLAISPADFIGDHLRHHIVDRIVHENALGYSGYATAGGLWLEFLAHTSYLAVPAGLILLAWDVVQGRQSKSPWLADQREVWLLFVVLTATIFTLIDWRMTKHIVLILLPLTLALGAWRDGTKSRFAATAVILCLLVALNILQVRGLAQDFHGFRITPAW